MKSLHARVWLTFFRRDKYTANDVKNFNNIMKAIAEESRI